MTTERVDEVLDTMADELRDDAWSFSQGGFAELAAPMLLMYAFLGTRAPPLRTRRAAQPQRRALRWVGTTVALYRRSASMMGLCIVTRRAPCRLISLDFAFPRRSAGAVRRNGSSRVCSS
jgi:hypothetical protein